MIGKRVYPDADGHISLLRGEYLRHERGMWLCCTPNGHTGNLSQHNVVEHDDKTITVSPSILVKDTKGKELWHGYLEKGVWREC